MTVPNIPENSLFKKLFDHIYLPDMEGAETSPKTASLLHDAKKMETLFTMMVDTLRTIPVPRVSELMKLFWHLVGNGITPAAVGPVPTVRFYAEKDFATVICPPDWRKKVAEEPHMQFGALIFAASHAKDYWNNRLDHGVMDRCRAYEAEYLHWVSRILDPLFRPNDYQKRVMICNGLDDLDHNLDYQGKEWQDESN